MGVYLPNMEMPKRGHTVTITIVGSGQAYVEYYDCRPHVEETIEYEAVSAPPHGRWRNIIHGIIPSGQCSNCGAWDRVTRFCPNCGSQMEGEE